MPAAADDSAADFPIVEQSAEPGVIVFSNPFQRQISVTPPTRRIPARDRRSHSIASP
jgi:hypothetical protein